MTPEPPEDLSGFELVPYRQRADVLFLGGAHLPSPASSITVRLGVFREEVLVDRTLAVYDDAPFQNKPLPILGPRCELSPPFDIADDLDWEDFQLAPLEQRCDYLRGDEWILLEGLSPLGVVVRSRLPSARGEARLQLPSWAGARAVAMWADTLIIDGHAGRCTVTWRGNVPLDDPSETEQAQIWAGVASAGEPIEWPGEAALEMRPAEPATGATVLLSDALADHDKVIPSDDAPRGQAPTPFEEAPDETVPLSDAMDSVTPAMPFEGSAEPPPLVAASDRQESGTTSLADALAGQPATPFESAPESTVPLSDVIVAGPATPFEGSGPAPPPSALEPTDDTGTVTLSDALHAEAAQRSATPFEPLGPVPVPGSPWARQPPSVASGPIGDHQITHHLGDRAFQAPIAPDDAPAASHFFHQLRRAHKSKDASSAISQWLPRRKSDVVPILGSTPLQGAVMKGSLRPPRTSLTMIVKGSFDLLADGAPRMRDSSDIPWGDQPAPPALGDGSTVRYPSDLAPFKPKADVMLIGSAHPPKSDGNACLVRFAFGATGNRFERHVAVFGERYWSPGIVRSMTEPAPFKSVPLDWSRAFGGSGFAANPAGIGRRADESGLQRLPNLENPKRLISAPGDRPKPVCFAPIPMTWPQRWKRLGSYDHAWLTKRWPYQPADFDWRFHQAAPQEQQLLHLQGDEPFDISGAHAEHGRLRGNLPGVRARAFACKTAAAGAGLEEIVLHLDTVVFDTDDLALHLVWRGIFEVDDYDASDVALLYVIHENLADEPRSIEQVESMLHARLAPMDVVPDDPAAPTEPANDVATDSIDGPPADAMAGGNDVDAAEHERLRQALDHQRDELERQVNARRAAAGLAPIDAANAPPAASPDVTEMVAKLRDTGMRDTHIAGLFGSIPGIPAALGMTAAEVSAITLGAPDVREVMQAAGVPKETIDETLQGFPEDPPGTAADAPPVPAPSVEDTGDEPLSVRMKVLAQLEGGGGFDGANLAGADLQGIDFEGRSIKGANLTGCDLSGAKLDGCDLTEAVMSACNLAGATLTNATLDRADLHAAILSEASFDGASVAATELTAAQADKASFRNVHGERLQLADASLAGARFDGAQVPSIDLTRSKIDGATFDGALMSRVRFYEARGEGARFDGTVLTNARADGAILPKAVFHAADASGSVWERADLSGASFHRCKLDAVSFVRATCERAIFSVASMRRGRLDNCKLAGAALLGADLMKASLQGADLTDADLRGANLYGVDGWRATMSNTKLDDANLQRSSVSVQKPRGAK